MQHQHIPWLPLFRQEDTYFYNGRVSEKNVCESSENIWGSLPTRVVFSDIPPLKKQEIDLSGLPEIDDMPIDHLQHLHNAIVPDSTNNKRNLARTSSKRLN